jgi:hypothetical protein
MFSPSLQFNADSCWRRPFHFEPHSSLLEHDSPATMQNIKNQDHERRSRKTHRECLVSHVLLNYKNARWHTEHPWPVAGTSNGTAVSRYWSIRLSDTVKKLRSVPGEAISGVGKRARFKLNRRHSVPPRLRLLDGFGQKLFVLSGVPNHSELEPADRMAEKREFSQTLLRRRWIRGGLDIENGSRPRAC